MSPGTSTSPGLGHGHPLGMGELWVPRGRARGSVAAGGGLARGSARRRGRPKASLPADTRSHGRCRGHREPAAATPWGAGGRSGAGGSGCCWVSAGVAEPIGVTGDGCDGAGRSARPQQGCGTGCGVSSLEPRTVAPSSPKTAPCWLVDQTGICTRGRREHPVSASLSVRGAGVAPGGTGTPS